LVPGLRYTLRCEPPADPPRNLIFHSLRLERVILFARHEASEHLAFYAERFHTVEVDSTLYAFRPLAPLKTGMLECLRTSYSRSKFPQTITHDKALVDCDAEIAEFLETMDILGPKLGPQNS
jgi:uncharacterized protein YecE (DUF72 family)